MVTPLGRTKGARPSGDLRYTLESIKGLYNKVCHFDGHKFAGPGTRT